MGSRSFGGDIWSLWRYEAAWTVPTPAVQAQLLAALNEPPARVIRLHTAPYSIVSYAWGHKYQQSNQWAVETLAGAMEPATIRTRPVFLLTHA